MMRIYITLIPPLMAMTDQVLANFQVVGIFDDGTVLTFSTQVPLPVAANQQQERAAILAALRSTASLIYPNVTIPANPTIRWLGI